MRSLRVTALMTALFASVALAGCSIGGKTSDTAVENTTESYEDIPDLAEGPVLSLGNTQASAGEVAEVTISVDTSGIDWSVCALHIAYPKELECLKTDELKNKVKLKLGEACADAVIKTASEWTAELPATLKKDGKKLVYVNTAFLDDYGKSGDIATLYFRVPEDAEPGTVYELAFCRYKTDVFTNSSNDKAVEKYAFEHWQNGTITVK